MSTNLRLINNTFKDGLGASSVFVNMGVTNTEPRFTNSAGIQGQIYREGAYTINLTDSVKYNYAGNFTVCFWYKFVDKGNTDVAFGNTITLVLNGGKTIQAKTPTTDSGWHWLNISRENDDITIQVDGSTVATDKSSEELDLLDKSYVFVGNLNKYFTGYDVIADDILIYEEKLETNDTLPDDYLGLTQFRKLIYYESDGHIWYGYGW